MYVNLLQLLQPSLEADAAVSAGASGTETEAPKGAFSALLAALQGLTAETENPPEAMPDTAAPVEPDSSDKTGDTEGEAVAVVSPDSAVASTEAESAVLAALPVTPPPVKAATPEKGTVPTVPPSHIGAAEAAEDTTAEANPARMAPAPSDGTAETPLKPEARRAASWSRVVSEAAAPATKAEPVNTAPSAPATTAGPVKTAPAIPATTAGPVKTAPAIPATTAGPVKTAPATPVTPEPPKPAREAPATDTTPRPSAPVPVAMFEAEAKGDSADAPVRVAATAAPEHAASAAAKAAGETVVTEAAKEGQATVLETAPEPKARPEAAVRWIAPPAATRPERVASRANGDIPITAKAPGRDYPVKTADPPAGRTGPLTVGPPAPARVEAPVAAVVPSATAVPSGAAVSEAAPRVTPMAPESSEAETVAATVTTPKPAIAPVPAAGPEPVVEPAREVTRAQTREARPEVPASRPVVTQAEPEAVEAVKGTVARVNPPPAGPVVPESGTVLLAREHVAHEKASRSENAPVAPVSRGESVTVGPADPKAGPEPAAAPVRAADSTPRVRFESLGDETVRQVKSLLTSGGERVRVRLIPESLGELHVEVRHHQGEVSVKLASASAAVREALETQAHGLRETLARDGMHLSRVDVSANLGPDTNAAGGQAAGRDGGPAGWASRGRPAAGWTAPAFRGESTAAGRPARTYSRTGGLDLRV